MPGDEDKLRTLSEDSSEDFEDHFNGRICNPLGSGHCRGWSSRLDTFWDEAAHASPLNASDVAPV